MTGNHEISTRPRRLIRYVLVVSLGFNLLFLGLIGGAIIRGGAPGHFAIGRDVAALGLRPYYRTLAPGHQANIKDGAEKRRQNATTGRAAFRAHFEALAAALVADPFKPEAVAEILTKQASMAGANIAFGQQLLLAEITTMTVAERAEMAEKLLSPPRHRKRFRN